MTGLEAYVRDRRLPLLAGDDDLVIPEDAEIVEWVAATLSAGEAPRPVGAACVYARWKPHVSTTACFEVRFTDGVDRLVTLKRYAGSKAEQIQRSFEIDEYTAALAEPLRGFAVDLESRTALFAFPTDRELVGLARLLTMRRTGRFLRESESFRLENIRHRRSSAKVLRYKPERRAVVRLDIVQRGTDGELESTVLAARVLPPDKARIVEVYRRIVFSGSEAPPAPALRGHETRPGVLFEEWLELEEMPAVVPCDADASGELLARLHAVGGAEATGTSLADRTALKPLFAIDPELARLAESLESPPELPGFCWIHGDFHRKQIGTVREGGTRVLLDLDELRPGHPIEDLASWLADAIAEDVDARVDTLRDSLLAAYERNGGVSPATNLLAAWTAGELSRKAAGCVRRLERGAVVRAKALLEAARTVLEDRR